MAILHLDGSEFIVRLSFKIAELPRYLQSGLKADPSTPEDNEVMQSALNRRTLLMSSLAGGLCATGGFGVARTALDPPTILKPFAHSRTVSRFAKGCPSTKMPCRPRCARRSRPSWRELTWRGKRQRRNESMLRSLLGLRSGISRRAPCAVPDTSRWPSISRTKGAFQRWRNTPLNAKTPRVTQGLGLCRGLRAALMARVPTPQGPNSMPAMTTWG